jgi:hypothetical protein
MIRFPLEGTVICSYSRDSVSTDSVSAVSIIHGLSRSEKQLKIKEINGL